MSDEAAQTETSPADATADDSLMAGSDTLAGGDSLSGDEGSDVIAEVPRDELHDSIDHATGTLTAEAVALRAERGISQAGETYDPGGEVSDDAED